MSTPAFGPKTHDLIGCWIDGAGLPKIAIVGMRVIEEGVNVEICDQSSFPMNDSIILAIPINSENDNLRIMLNIIISEFLESNTHPVGFFRAFVKRLSIARAKID